jgi:isopentenyl phosphate kinase
VGLPVILFPPSGGITTQDRVIINWNLDPISSALENGLVPLVYGDVVFDTVLGGTILSTEDLFMYLAKQLKPDRILLAGRDPGVWKDYPECTVVMEEITPSDLPDLGEMIGSAKAPDVTGGMQAKVKQMLALVQQISHLEVVIFSGEEPGSIHSALSGITSGTVLHI